MALWAVCVPELYLCSNVEGKATSNVWTDESFVDLLSSYHLSLLHPVDTSYHCREH